MQIEVLSTPSLGDRTYVVHSGRTAIVIDPQRDLDRVEEILAQRDLRVAVVAETHIHNDYLTGGLVLAERTGARYLVSENEPVMFPRIPVGDGSELTAGSLHLRVLHTPGHTPNHLAYLVRDSRQPDHPAALFTGGSLLYGSVGRTDLIDPAQTVSLTGAQYRSVLRLLEVLPEDTEIFPTHGFGSFCSAGSVHAVAASTIGVEKTSNDVATAVDERTFVDTLLANLTAYPAYYAHMAPLNLAGPGPADLGAVKQVESDELVRRLKDGEWVVDLRSRIAYAADHVGGSVSIELGDQFAIYLGWLLPWGAEITLIGDDSQQIADAHRQLIRIGVEGITGAAVGPIDEISDELEHRSYRRVRFRQVPLNLPANNVILDVRRDDERRHGHIEGSLHIPLPELLTRLAELPDARLWVHCGSGFRAGIAASILDRARRPVVHIDDLYSNSGDRGLEPS